MTVSPAPVRRPPPFLLPGALALLAGLWTGLVRMGVPLPPLAWPPAEHHGPLMVGGFLGTLIGLERAQALAALRGARWAFLSPLASGLGGLALIAGLPHPVPHALLTAGAVGLAAMFVVIVRERPDLPHRVMGLGALALLAAAVAWTARASVPQVAPWWVAFLVLTVAGERLELAHLGARGERTPGSFVIALVLLLAGPAIGLWNLAAGVRLSGAALIVVGLWLLQHDLARRTIRTQGLPRFIAACLLSGYAWLLIAGAAWIAWPADWGAGPRYDLMLHAVLIGFVFSMIFGHAPIILPAVTGMPLAYRPRFYAHLALLHAGLIVRAAGDLSGSAALRRHGGELNAVAILFFLGSTIVAVIQSRAAVASAATARR